MNYNILLLIQTIEFLKASSWVLSIIAIIISLISAIFVIVDKLKTWKELGQNKKLKKDKAILQSIIELKIENFSEERFEFRKEKNIKRTIHKAHYSKLDY